MLRTVSLAAALVAVSACLSACGSARGSAAPRPLVIGALFSLTGDGSSIGPQQANGARLAVADVNRAGGVDGARLRIDIRDDRTDPATAVAQLRDLARGRSLAVLGPTLSIVALSADPVANRLHVPMLAVSNTIKGLVGRCAYPCGWTWRASLGEAVAVPADVDAYTRSARPRSAAILYTAPDALGQQEAAAAAATFRRDGVTDLHQILVPATETDLRPYVEQALSTHPAVLFVGSSFAAAMVSVIEAARGNGYRGGILGGNVLNSDTTASLAGRLGAGAQSAAAWSVDNAFPANATFVARYVQRYGVQPDEFAAQAYAGVQILAQALERGRLAGSTKPAPDERASLQKALPEVALETPLGPFRFTADHDVRQIVWIRTLDGRGGNKLVGFCDPGC